MQISAELKAQPEIQLRMGIHSGPIRQIQDVNDRSNVAGAGIDLAQRVMDCGDARHILVSKGVADDLAPYQKWNKDLHELGECEVKHGRKISLFNFYRDGIGNPQAPSNLRCLAETHQSSWWTTVRRRRNLIELIAVALVAASLAIFFLVRSTKPTVAVLPSDLS